MCRVRKMCLALLRCYNEIIINIILYYGIVLTVLYPCGCYYCYYYAQYLHATFCQSTIACVSLIINYYYYLSCIVHCALYGNTRHLYTCIIMSRIVNLSRQF